MLAVLGLPRVHALHGWYRIAASGALRIFWPRDMWGSVLTCARWICPGPLLRRIGLYGVMFGLA